MYLDIRLVILAQESAVFRYNLSPPPLNLKVKRSNKDCTERSGNSSRSGSGGADLEEHVKEDYCPQKAVGAFFAGSAAMEQSDHASPFV
jgi:hypothetical protein